MVFVAACNSRFHPTSPAVPRHVKTLSETPTIPVSPEPARRYGRKVTWVPRPFASCCLCRRARAFVLHHNAVQRLVLPQGGVARATRRQEGRADRESEQAAVRTTCGRAGTAGDAAGETRRIKRGRAWEAVGGKGKTIEIFLPHSVDGQCGDTAV